MIDQIDLDIDLLDASHEAIELPPELAACINAHGLYSTQQFVLRLSPRIHELISSIPPGIYNSDDLGAETVQAYSTYIHETVHWWQHIGSSSGLMLSLAYPAQSHANVTHLRQLVDAIGPVKSIRKWVHDAQLENSSTAELVDLANTVVNNVFDLDFYKAIVVSPNREPELYQHRYYQAAGHSFHITYTHVVDLLAATVDHSFDFLPDVRKWEKEFIKLKEEEVTGYFWRSPVIMPPVGLHAIFEGQARFIQLQYLASSIAPHHTFEDFGRLGHFDGIYYEAFRVFLEMTGSVEPKKIVDPIVGLFLLVCDIALNPSVGFPRPIQNFERFFFDVHPGIRFAILCGAIHEKCPELLTAIRGYSKDEYLSVSKTLCEACGFDVPQSALEEVARWADKETGIIKLMSEYETFHFGLENQPARVLLSHHIAYSLDKLDRPEFFVWSGVWMAGSRCTEEIQSLFLRHLSLYGDKSDSDGVFPREIPGKDSKGLKGSFDTFFGNNMIYDLTRQ